MATINSLEEIVVWKLARELNKEIYRIARYPEFAKDYRFVAQMTAASGSVMDNIAEGYGREGNKEFVQFLFMAMGSLSELKSQTYRAYDVGYIDESELNVLIAQQSSLAVKLQNFIKTLKSSSLKGIKYSIGK